MKNRNIWKEIGDFVLGKGFYMVLALCLLTVAASGYYLWRGMGTPQTPLQETGSDTQVTLPEVKPSAVEPEKPTLPRPQTQTPAAVKPQTQQIQPLPQTAPAQEEAETAAPVQPPRAVVFTWPVKGEVLRGFSVDALALDPTLGDWRTHAGMDIAAPVGTRVLAMSTGTVAQIRRDALMGTCVVVDHGEGLQSTYCNLADEVVVKQGEVVTTGAILGTVGESAIAEGELPSHLHLETSFHGDAVDPAEYLPEGK